MPTDCGIGKRKVHLPDNPDPVLFFKNTGPSHILPSYRSAVPFAKIIQQAIKPGYISISGEGDSQILNFIMCCLKLRIHPESIGYFSESLYPFDLRGIRVNDQQISII